jgi:acetyl esterase/lipase
MFYSILKRALCASLLLMMSAMQVFSQDIPSPVKLAGAPAADKPEKFDGHVVTNIYESALYVFPADEAKRTGAAVVICPGGGYIKEAVVHEGWQMAQWLADEGVTAIVLKYRLPYGNKDIPLSDVGAAFRWVRSKADSLGIDKARIGVAGSSAGGHLAATAGTMLTGDERPDFMLLFYPVISMEEGLTHKGSRENLLGKNPSSDDVVRYSADKQVSASTPPTLLLLSDDDKAVPPQNSTLFYKAMKDNGVKGAMYVFPTGGHGWGFRDSFAYYDTWKSLLLDWLRTSGFTTQKE